MPNSYAEEIDKLSFRELQAECRDKNVSSGGKSADLRKRLKAKCQRTLNNLLKLTVPTAVSTSESVDDLSLSLGALNLSPDIPQQNC